MADVAPQLILIVVLVVVNAAFAGTELALVSLRPGQLQQLEQRSATGAVLARLAREPNRFLATIQIGITLAGFLASAAAAVSLAEPVEGVLGFLGAASRPASIVIVTLVLSYFTLVFGELAPKRLAMQKSERWGLVMARPLAFMSALTRPVVWLLSHSTDLAVRVLGGDPSRHREDVTGEEIRDMVASQSEFTPQQRLIMDGAFEIAERTIDQVMTPRGDVFVIDADWPAERALDELSRSGHSRAPVAEQRNLDQTRGIIHLRQLLGSGDEPASSLVSEALLFPESARVLTALREFQQRRVQMALVVNEHGGGEGVVTVEDLVEEIVGEIYDETDSDLVGVRHAADGTLLLSGRFPMHDLDDLGVDLPEGEYTTIAGLVLDQLGHIPTPGETLVLDGWHLEVRSVARHTITEVSLRRAETDAERGTDTES